MLAALNITQYPYFDISEIIPEPEYVFKPYNPVKPMKAGDIIPNFSLQTENANWQQFVNGNEVHGPVLLNRLLNKPLVISFYSPQWGQYGLNLLQQLSAIQQEIKVAGGNLLLIVSEKDKALQKTAWDNNLTLSFYFDRDNEIAEKFRIYDDNNPVWNKFSGIDTNVPLLATYVISPAGQIEYDHIDPDFSAQFPSENIVRAVQKTGISNSKIRNINAAIGR
jgi:peroxiredoxin